MKVLSKLRKHEAYEEYNFLKQKTLSPKLFIIRYGVLKKYLKLILDNDIQRSFLHSLHPLMIKLDLSEKERLDVI